MKIFDIINNMKNKRRLHRLYNEYDWEKEKIEVAKEVEELRKRK
jgi:hypothetical protein